VHSEGSNLIGTTRSISADTWQMEFPLVLVSFI
jgi:hypothetical protein